MRETRTASCILLWTALSLRASADELLRDPLTSLRGWLTKPRGAVTADEGGMKVIARRSNAGAMRRLDAARLAGKTIIFTVQAKGQDIRVGPHAWCCAKMQVVYRTSKTGKPRYAAKWLSGTFDWRPVELCVRFPKRVESASLLLGFQQSSGVARFRNLVAEEQKFDDSFPYEIPADLRRATYRVSIDTRRARPVNRLLYGFNTNLSAGRVSYGSPTIHRGVSQLRPGVLRFPGGTIGNWYQWRTDDFAGHPAYAPAFARATQRFRAEGRRYGFEDYVALVRRYDIEPIIMVNILSQSPEDAAAWFAHMKQIKFSVRFCELGNEIYLRQQNNDSTKTVEGYIRVTRRFASALRAQDPNLRIAVVCAPLRAAGRSSKYAHWNRALAKERYYDAVVHHEYPGPRNDIFRRATIEQYLAGEAMIDETVAAFRKTFGRRPMWMTEWNMAIKGMPSFSHTGLHALFDASRWLRMVEHSETIRIACYHQIFSRMFSPFAEGRDGRPIKFGEFAVWRLVGDVTRECDDALATTITPSARAGWAFPMAAAKAFRGDEGLRLLLVNKLPIAKRVEIRIDGALWKGEGESRSFSVSRLSERRVAGLDESLLRVSSFRGAPIAPPYSVTEFILQSTAPAR